jgi:hypothetical protein
LAKLGRGLNAKNLFNLPEAKDDDEDEDQN